MRVIWTARRSNQLIGKEINLEYSLETLMQNAKSRLKFAEEASRAKALRWEQSLLCGNKKEKAHVSSIVNMALGIMR